MPREVVAARPPSRHGARCRRASRCRRPCAASARRRAPSAETSPSRHARRQCRRSRRPKPIVATATSSAWPGMIQAGSNEARRPMRQHHAIAIAHARRRASPGEISSGLSQVSLVNGRGNSCSQALFAKRPSQRYGSGRNSSVRACAPARALRRRPHPDAASYRCGGALCRAPRRPPARHAIASKSAKRARHVCRTTSRATGASVGEQSKQVDAG